VTAAEAYAMWKADPEGVKILDVRMVEEYVFLGHAAMAISIPVAFPKYQ
jgi:rhodanese-related sulfurtransferase